MLRVEKQARTVLEGTTELEHKRFHALARAEAEALRVPGWKLDETGSDQHEIVFAIEQDTIGRWMRGILNEPTRTYFRVFLGDDGQSAGTGRRKILVGLDDPSFREVLGFPLSIRGARAYEAFLSALRTAIQNADPTSEVRVFVDQNE